MRVLFCREEFEPVKYFKQFHTEMDTTKRVDAGVIWINRMDLRKLESALKERFVQWMNEDKNKIDSIFSRLEADVKDEFDKRSKLFNMVCHFISANRDLIYV